MREWHGPQTMWQPCGSHVHVTMAIHSRPSWPACNDTYPVYVVLRFTNCNFPVVLYVQQFWFDPSDVITARQPWPLPIAVHPNCTYTVLPTDTLDTIASTLRVPRFAMEEVNLDVINSSDIQPGMVLNVPKYYGFCPSERGHRLCPSWPAGECKIGHCHNHVTD